MAGTSFIAVGNASVNTASVDYAAWLVGAGNPQTGSLQVTLAGSKDCLFLFETPGCVELAAAVGLGEQAAAWTKVEDAKAKAAEKALKDAAKAEAETPHKSHKAHG